MVEELNIGGAPPRVAVLSIAGGGDRLLARPEAARRFADRFPPGGVDTWVERAGHRGMTWDPDHMGLAADDRSRPCWERIGRWLDGVLTLVGSGRSHDRTSRVEP